MNLSGASFIISLFSLAIAAATAFGVAEQVKRWRFGPRLSVNFDGISQASGRGVSYHVRVPIANGPGRLAAKETTVYVEDIQISARHSLDPSKKAVTIPGYVPMRFPWCHGIGFTQTVPGGESRLFDLCEIQRDSATNALRCLFRGEVVPANGAFDFGWSGEMFEIALSISAESGETLKQLLLLKPTPGESFGAEVSRLD